MLQLEFDLILYNVTVQDFSNSITGIPFISMYEIQWKHKALEFFFGGGAV